VTDVGARLAQHVAEAADAWLRDPLDAGVYRRLVAATLAWRSRAVPDGGPVARAVDEPPQGVGDEDREVRAVPDDERYFRPDRAPRPVGSALADVASLLRARSDAARSGGGASDAARPGAESSED
jgi:hypothetical protein